jgi:flagellar basal-body rod protein FlgB
MAQLTSPVSAAVAVALDALSMRQQAIATNLANVNTVGYRAVSVDFEEALQSALRTATDQSEQTLLELADVRDGISRGDFTHTATTAGPDSGVEIDMELAHMSETVLRYQALVQGLGKYGSLARMAITGEAKT